MARLPRSFPAVAIKRRHSNQRGNFATVELSQFGHLGQEQGRRHCRTGNTPLPHSYSGSFVQGTQDDAIG